VSLLLGLSFFCWAHLTISRPLFPGSPASHDIYVYASPLVALVAVVAAWSARRPRANRWLLAGSLLWLLAALAGARGATDPALALTWTLWLAIALTLLASGVDRPAMAAGLAVGALASLPLMVFQAIAQTTWPAAAIQGWAGGELGPAVRGAAVLSDERWLRPYGLMPHPNIAGGVAALASVLLAAVWLRDRRLWQLAGSAAAFSEVLLSFSRSAWLGAAAGLVLLICLRRGGTRPLLAAIVLPAMLFVVACGGLILERTAASGTLESDSLSQRVYLAQTALQLWRGHPLVGIGPGAVQPGGGRSVWPKLYP
jgi:O-antigen ligase